MFYQRCTGAGDIWIANLAMHLCICDKRMKQLFFLIILFKPVKIQQVVNAKPMSGSYKTINRNFGLQSAGSADPDNI